MTGRPVAQYLARFDAERPQDAADVAEDHLACSPLAVLTPVEDRALLIQMARDEGRAEGLEIARAEQAAALAEEKLRFERRLAADRAAWANEEARRLAERLVVAISEAEANIAGSVARILRGYLPDVVRRKAVEQFADDIRTLFAGKAHPIVRISGAADLLAVLAEELSSLADAIEYAPDQSADVTAIADQTLIETRMEAWLERVKDLSE